MKVTAVPRRDSLSLEMEKTLLCIYYAYWPETCSLTSLNGLAYDTGGRTEPTFLSRSVLPFLVFLVTVIKMRDDPLGSTFPYSSIVCGIEIPLFVSILPYSSYNFTCILKIIFFFSGHTFCISGKNISKFLLCSKLFNVLTPSQR